MYYKTKAGAKNLPIIFSLSMRDTLMSYNYGVIIFMQNTKWKDTG